MNPSPTSTKSTADKDQQVKQMGTSRQEFKFGLPSPVARQEQLWLSEYLSDVVFKVGSSGQLMHAHKLILTVASEVFYAQFNGGFDESQKNNREHPITIEDIKPAIFAQVLRFIYCEKVDLSPDNIMDVYCASEKYLLTGLTTVCKQFLKKTLNVTNVVKVLNGNRQYGFANVDELCLDIIRDNPLKCFQSDDFLALSRPALDLIVACRTMNCQKDQLVTAIRKWCETNDPEADIKPQLEALQCDRLYAFSAFRYDTNVSTALKIQVKGKMHLHGLGVYIGAKPNCITPSSVMIMVNIEPRNLTVTRTVQLKKNLYVEKILFEKIIIRDECRISVTLSNMELFCLAEFKPVDTLGPLELTVTDMKFTENVPQPNTSLFARSNNIFVPAPPIFPSPTFTPPIQRTNCVAYLLYSLNSNATTSFK